MQTKAASVRMIITSAMRPAYSSIQRAAFLWIGTTFGAERAVKEIS